MHGRNGNVTLKELSERQSGRLITKKRMNKLFCTIYFSPHEIEIEESEVLPSIVGNKYNSDPGHTAQYRAQHCNGHLWHQLVYYIV